MYCLSDKQIDYILSDIGARGVEMESLQQNLLDHICCIIENDLEDGEDFERFYQKTIKTFYKDALWEIEEETIFLLTFKNYYHMKKIMILSGAFAAVTMVLGILFKFMHWPGASLFVVLGIATSSLVFLPLLFTIKAKEQRNTKERVILGVGMLSGILISLSILFKVMHWPGANMMGLVSLALLTLVFLPVYFFTGMRDPEKKVNTMTTTIIIIMFCGLWLTLMRSPKSSRLMDVRDTSHFVLNEQIVKTEQKQLARYTRSDSTRSSSFILGQKIVAACQDLKDQVVQQETGTSSISADFEHKSQLLKEQNGIDPFSDEISAAKVKALLDMIDVYNAFIQEQKKSDLAQIPTQSYFIEDLKKSETGLLSLMKVLNGLTQVQMFVLQNERELIAVK